MPPKTYTGPGHYVLYYDWNGVGGITEKGLQIAASPNGTVPAGQSDQITVILPAGLTFSDGSTTKVYFASGDPTSVVIPPREITVSWGTSPGTKTIQIQYKTLTETVGVYVGEGGNVYAWGVNGSGQADGQGPGNLGTPYPWGYTSDRTSQIFTYSTYTAVTGTNAAFAAYTDLYNKIATSGDFNKGIYRRNFDAKSVVTHSTAHSGDAVFFWGNDGKLYAYGSNNGDMFSVGDGTAYNGTKAYATPVAAGTKVLEANPGKTITSVVLGTDKDRAAYILSDKTVWHSGANTGYGMGLNIANTGQFLAGQTLKTDGTPLTDVVSVAIGQEGTIFLDGSGNIWGAGLNNNSEGQFVGLTPGYSYSAANVLSLPEGKQVSKIWAAGLNFIVRATDGALYISGANSSGMGSTGSLARSRNAWTKINVAAGKTVADIALKSGQALYRMTDGTVFFCGDNSANGAGKGGTFNTAMTQVPLQASAVDIAVTNTNSYAAIIR